MMNKARFDMLKFISQRPITRTDLARGGIKSSEIERRLNVVRALVQLGYVRDYGDQHGRRIPVNLRIWGVTDAGRAVLEQQALTENKSAGGQGQFGLLLAPKESLSIKSAKPLAKPKEVKESKHGRSEEGINSLHPTGRE